MERNLAVGWQVLRNRKLSDKTYVLRFERQGLVFKPGQHLSVGIWGQKGRREYSIYSSVDKDYLEILIKEIEEGEVSRQLRKVKTGDMLDVQGPFGYFTLKEETLTKPHLFIATGTGISPFHSIVTSHPELNYTLLHGVAGLDERYEHPDYDQMKIFSCISREEGGDYFGRVTDYLKTVEIERETQVYLCGNCAMIYDAFDYLKALGVAPDNIHTEVYF